ncbi:hypothetical protein [Pseudomonas subflava]|uniref:hypothetical protein n=1 Tax=Pseudomonas subflava TaxID=2952933 RepID=UPI002079F2E3|nr:hypothetical protein [Pseudomonas subflava]HSX72531.1 hypothetical protein [Pseudomonas sp.]
MKRGEAIPPPTLGEGCLQRYDPEALKDSDGTEFPGAAELWKQLQDKPAAEKGEAQESPAPGRD